MDWLGRADLNVVGWVFFFQFLVMVATEVEDHAGEHEEENQDGGDCYSRYCTGGEFFAA